LLSVQYRFLSVSPLFLHPLSSGDGRALGTNSSRRSIILLGTFLVAILILFFASLFFLVSFYSRELFSVFVILIALISVSTILWIAYDIHIHREVVAHLSALCHGKKSGEKGLCPRCKGFYLGLLFFGVLSLIKDDLFIDFLNYVGFFAYSTLLVLMLLLVLIHVALRRLKKIDGEFLLGITGFLFPLIIYMLGSLIVVLALI
jgi:hypothetical protein